MILGIPYKHENFGATHLSIFTAYEPHTAVTGHRGTIKNLFQSWHLNKHRGFSFSIPVVMLSVRAWLFDFLGSCRSSSKTLTYLLYKFSLTSLTIDWNWFGIIALVLVTSLKLSLLIRMQCCTKVDNSFAIYLLFHAVLLNMRCIQCCGW